MILRHQDYLFAAGSRLITWRVRAKGLPRRGFGNLLPLLGGIVVVVVVVVVFAMVMTGKIAPQVMTAGIPLFGQTGESPRRETGFWPPLGRVS